MDAIYGVTMEQLAEIFSEEGRLRTQHGEQRGRVEFDRYLAGRGLDINVWAHAWNGWQDRFRADPTGRTEARFQMLLQQHAARVHFGDVRDMSADTAEGITLDQYAQITVAVSRAGANAEEIVRRFGLTDVAHWQRANAAWTKKMSEDTSHRLTMQYGQLYSKHAGPAFQEEQIAKTAAVLAAANARRDVVDEPQEELTPELCLQKMQSPSRDERWKYAGLYANMVDLGNVPDKRAGIVTVTPLLLEMIERHDEHTTSDAEKAARKLWDLGDRSSEFRGAVSRCLGRAQEKLASVQAAFAPIQNQAVPERVTLQSRIQDYQSLVDTMQEYANEDWSSGAPEQAKGPPAHAQAMAIGSPIPFPQHPPIVPMRAGGLPKWAFAPVILLAVGGAAFFVNRGRARMPEKPTVSSASISSAAAPTSRPLAASAPAPVGATETAPSAQPDAPSTPKAAPGKAGKGKKKH